MEQSIKIARMTGWISLTPLVALPVIAWTGSPEWLARLLVTWAAMLLAFWAGTLWMRHVGDEPGRPWLMVASIALAMLAWAAVSLPFHWALFWLAALYVVHLVIDEPWRAQGQPNWYRRMRLMLAIVAISLLVVSGLIGAAGAD